MVASTLSTVAALGLSLYNLKRARDDRRRLDAEIAERRAVEARTVLLLRELPPADAKSRGLRDFQEFKLGEDPVLDRAVRLAHEWRAVLMRWNEGAYQVRLRGLTEPPDNDQKYGWQ